MKKVWRNVLPLGLRRVVRVLQRQIEDHQKGVTQKFVKRGEIPTRGFLLAKVHQPIFNTTGATEKVHNLQIAIQCFSKVLIRPGEVFSFWKILGLPSQKQGFQQGRNIIAGKLTRGYGGGLCQMSGLLYHLFLLGRLSIVERHAHSLDLYTEETRYTPLGADATVVYAYKDLRIENSFNAYFWLQFTLTHKGITGYLYCSSSSHTAARVEFRRKPENALQVETVAIMDGHEQLVATSLYEKNID